ncbi:MAG: hypothetical protein WBB37_05505 [bacterium]
MSDINLIFHKVKKYAHEQRVADLIGLLLIMLMMALISISIALLLLKSPWYGMIGILPVFFYRPTRLIERARVLENKIGFKGELVNSIQLSLISMDNKENYSPELISAYISDAAKKIKAIEPGKYVSYKPIYSGLRFLLIATIFALIHPVVAPGHFWYALNHRIFHTVEPGTSTFIEGSSVDIGLSLDGVYIPKNVDLIIIKNYEKTVRKISVLDDLARDDIKLDGPIGYYFTFLDKTTEQYFLKELKQVYIEELSFFLKYPAYTKLKDDIKTGRQLIVPEGTEVVMRGKASQSLRSGIMVMKDTIIVKCEDTLFAAEFKVTESSTAMLHLTAATDIKEQIVLYSVSDLPPLVDIFYPGLNISLPHDMQIDIGIRCSDDYGLNKAIFYYKLEETHEKKLDIQYNALEDTVYFIWDMSGIGMLPGDEIVYYAEITDNAGKVSKSKSFYIYFPTIEEIYEDVDRKEELVQTELEDLKKEHTDEMDEISRLHEKIMKERELLWADQEKLLTAISKEKDILEKIDEWQTEFEKTIKELKEGVVLDRESIEHLQEIARILQEIAPEELRKALTNLQKALKKGPQDIEMALGELKKQQEEMAKAIERTLEILKRYQQEEKIKELANMAEELAEKAEEIDQASKQQETSEYQKEISDLQKAIDQLSKELQALADDEGLEQDIREALEELARQTQDMASEMSPQPGDMQKNLTMTAADLQKLYEKLTGGRAAQLREKLLDIVNQLIDISKTEEMLSHEKTFDIAEQNQIINATKAVAESLYAQQTKSLHVTPSMGKNLAKAITHMEKAKDVAGFRQNTQEAMKQINLACLEMLKKLEQAVEGTSSTGMDDFLQKLSGISQGQMSITQSMNGLFPIPVSGLTGAQKAQLQRLAGKQQALRQALETLRNEVGPNQHQSMLDNVIEEMKQTEEELYKYKIDRELIERQKKIISRLLDAQKSIRKEDYEKKRKSKTAQEFLVRENPNPLPQELGKDKLRELIQQALRESYPKEYELYIREYFKKLLEER